MHRFQALTKIYLYLNGIERSIIDLKQLQLLKKRCQNYTSLCHHSKNITFSLSAFFSGSPVLQLGKTSVIGCRQKTAGSALSSLLYHLFRRIVSDSNFSAIRYNVLYSLASICFGKKLQPYLSPRNIYQRKSKHHNDARLAINVKPGECNVFCVVKQARIFKDLPSTMSTIIIFSKLHCNIERP